MTAQDRDAASELRPDTYRDRLGQTVRFFPFSRRRFRCPECHRWLTRTTAGARACFYAESHGGSILYERSDPRVK